MSAGQLPPPGTMLRKVDRNGVVRCEATVGQNGQVVYRGVTYSSISAAAKAASVDIGLAARSCDGYAFFGLKNRDGAAAPPRTVRPSLPLPLPVCWDDLPSSQENTLYNWTRIILPVSGDVRGAVSDHDGHGRADASGAPRDADCDCRNTPLEVACAEAGCGFCRAARMATAALAPAHAEPTAPPASAPIVGYNSDDGLQPGALIYRWQPVPAGCETCAGCPNCLTNNSIEAIALSAPVVADLHFATAHLEYDPFIDPEGNAYREAAARSASSASTQDGIVEEVASHESVEIAPSVPSAVVVDDRVEFEVGGCEDLNGGRCAENRAAGGRPCGACAWCCRQATDRAERAERAEATLAKIVERYRARPRIVCLCGSIQWSMFFNAFQRAIYDETMSGRIVLTAGFYPLPGPRGWTSEQKNTLDVLLKQKIDLADEVLVINAGGYVGVMAQSAIVHALATGKPVRYLESTDHGPASEGSPATSASGTEGERRQDADVVGTVPTASKELERETENSGGGPAAAGALTGAR